MLNEYIDNPEQYKTYELAEKAESNPHLWVDKLSNNFIEIHSSDYNGEMFCIALTDFINNNIDNCDIKIKDEKLYINKRYCIVPYAIIFNINGQVSC